MTAVYIHIIIIQVLLRPVMFSVFESEIMNVRSEKSSHRVWTMSFALFLLQFLYASLCCYRRLHVFQYDSNSEYYRLVGSMATARTIRKP